ncbi:MAG: phosphate acyltransferase PlsX [Chloroflexi bacterium]|nr:phosphate acyltransferase PlsX [Chloroflexota bacterium]
MRIVLDAMGSDNHPIPEVEAAIEAARIFKEEIILSGPIDILKPMLENISPGSSRVKVVHAPDVFEMADKISSSSLRRSNNSLSVAIDLLKSGEADAFVTAGNTGGAMAIGLARTGRIKGVKRPALCAIVPVQDGRCVFLDIGANVTCKPDYLLQFAVMGSVYAEKMLGVNNPRVGLLSNGEEASKGNDLVKSTYPLLEASGMNFIGNVEGKELFGGAADVVVTDGYTGNILLKASEAVAKLLTDKLRDELMATPITKIGAALAKPAFRELKKHLDPSEIGAAPLLGLNNLVFVGHGRSKSRALVNAIHQARQAVEVNLLDSLTSSIEKRLN